MSIQSKPDYKIFASDAKSGEIETFPDILRGWGVTIDRTGEIPPMEWFNAIGKRADEWLLYLTQRGIPEWDASLDYPKTAVVTHGDVIYISIRASKGEQPNTTQAAWSKLSAFLGLGNYYTKTESDTKFQPKGDYATNAALNNGLALKFDKTGGTITGDVTFSKNAIKSTKGTHALPAKSGALMQVGDYGWGGSGEGKSLSNPELVEFFRNENTPTQVFRNINGADPLFSYSATAYFRASYSFSAFTASHEGGGVRVIAGNSNNEEVFTYNLYTDRNTTKDSNGFLRTGSATALTTGQVVQTSGSSTTNVMSQKAVTDALSSSELIQSADQIIGNASDFNKARPNAVFFGYSSAANNAGMTGVGIDIAQVNGDYRLQLISDFYGKQIAFRTRNVDTKTWSDWSKFFHTGNVGTDRNGNLKASGSSSELSDYPVGAPIPWPQSTPPSGFLVCNGQSFNKTNYPLLAKSYPSGVLPDLRGEFIRGLDAGRGIDTGREVLSSQAGNSLLSARGLASNSEFSLKISSGSVGTDNQGHREIYQQIEGRNGNETRPRNIAFLYIVRAA